MNKLMICSKPFNTILRYIDLSNIFSLCFINSLFRQVLFNVAKVDRWLRVLFAVDESYWFVICRCAYSRNLADAAEVLNITSNCVKRLKEIASDGDHLRITVEGGGCAGYQYKFELDNQVSDDDRWAAFIADFRSETCYLPPLCPPLGWVY